MDVTREVTIISGAAGFIGSHLVDFYLACGHKVIAIDNLITGRRENLAACDGNKEFIFVEHDVTEYVDVSAVHEGQIHNVLHFASPASPVDFLRFPIKIMKVGSLGTHNMLGVALAHKAKFLMASTSEVYGDPLVHPQPEAYRGNVNPVGPRSMYDEAKRFAEALTMAYNHTHKLDTRIARIFNTYGPRMRVGDGRALPNFINQALEDRPVTVYGDGSQTRSFCYIDDMVEGIDLLLRSEEKYPVNLGNPDEITIKQTAGEVIALTGSASEVVHRELPADDPARRRPDITKARKTLGWFPKTSREDGLEATIGYFRGLAGEDGA